MIFCFPIFFSFKKGCIISPEIITHPSHSILDVPYQILEVSWLLFSLIFCYKEEYSFAASSNTASYLKQMSFSSLLLKLNFKVTQYLGFLGTSEKDGSIIKVTDFTKISFPSFFFISKQGNFLFWKRRKCFQKEKREAFQ